MATPKKGAKAAPGSLSVQERTILRHASGNIAYTTYPLPPGDKNALRRAVASLQKRGLLSNTGREPQLTADGRTLCRELAARGWDEAQAEEDPKDPKGGAGDKGGGDKGGGDKGGGDKGGGDKKTPAADKGAGAPADGKSDGRPLSPSG